ncbi:MSF1 domain-containing protein [Rutstroemia sp. NJR-2017a BBW]|nr:MSF1 domain-containing protein [Rutstroemia sp. NJR-2017a BBW]
MVKFYESSYSYDYSFPAVTLAYFLRYPNPHSTHVLSTDVISRTVDPTTGRLRTVRIHRKSSRLPSAVLKLLPKSVLGNRAMPKDEEGDFSVGPGMTDVRTQVMFKSRLGERLRAMRKTGEEEVVVEEEKKGWLSNWSTKGVQRSIEAIASRKTENQLGKSKEGMTVVLERLRNGGLVAVLEGMRKDRELTLAGVES